MWTNDELRETLRVRMEKGRAKYGHGLQPDMDTRQWGTRTNSWLEMAEEEYLDGIMYILTDYLRFKGSSTGRDNSPELLELIYGPIENITSLPHREMLLGNIELLNKISRYRQSQ